MSEDDPFTEARHQIETALLKIDGVVAVLRKMSWDDQHGVVDVALDYLADQLREHYQEAQDAFEKMWKAHRRQT